MIILISYLDFSDLKRVSYDFPRFPLFSEIFKITETTICTGSDLGQDTDQCVPGQVNCHLGIDQVKLIDRSWSSPLVCYRGRRHFWKVPTIAREDGLEP
jgi:hypothetical protein